MAEIYYLLRKRNKEDNAAFKAPIDIEEVCRRRGYIAFDIESYPGRSNRIFQKLWLLTYCVGWWRKLYHLLGEGDTVIYQHPLYGIRIAMKWIKKAKKDKNCRFIALIHDLPTLRGPLAGDIKEANEKTARLGDIELLKLFDAVICHNDKMGKVLTEYGIDQKRIISLGLFDYLMNEDAKMPERQSDLSVAIAGNLIKGKSGYIYNIKSNGQNEGLKINLYGSNHSEEDMKEGMVWQGAYDPDELPHKLMGSFGIVWDGSSSETCSGNYGNYLRYNDPHKVSLYLVSGLPIIIWEEAALAGFIRDNKLGITVKSLYELEDRLKRITQDEYKEMCENVKVISEKLRSGYYFNNALDKALLIISEAPH